MGFKEKYTTDKTDASKLYLSPESFAICELLEELTKTIQSLRNVIK